MEKVISSEKIPIKMWLHDLEESALQQARNLANLPFAFRHISLMPDAHSGYGMPIGGVLATHGVIIPNAVGVDIGCGMCAVQTNLPAARISAKKMNGMVAHIREVVPVGFNHHPYAQDEKYMPQGHDYSKLKIAEKQRTAALKQIGTLGGGNHFIEFQKDQHGHVWLMVHSGSRNVGKQVADHYNKLAKKLNERWHTSISPKFDLAFLPFETHEALNYYREMRYCVDFALASRSLMLTRIMEVVHEFFPETKFEPIINKAHNYAAWEEHFGQKVVVHRKGATSAQAGETGIIPGSMGSKSYIVSGLGNPESFMSCSHGAGRQMSRSAAIKNLDLNAEIRLLENQGIVHSLRTTSDLDEAPSAYKDIQAVMQFQRDLVAILFELTPLAVVKG